MLCGRQRGLLREACRLRAAACAGGLDAGQTRGLGGGVPEFWGQKSQYTEGTEFLGTPKDHMDRVRRRPLSPDVFDIKGSKPHYKFPLPAITSIANRVTGVTLSGGCTAIGLLALTGDLAPVMDTVAAPPVLCSLAKFGVSLPLTYHFFGGLRHFAWDHGKIGAQTDTTSMLELESANTSSKVLLGVSAVTALAMSVM